MKIPSLAAKNGEILCLRRKQVLYDRLLLDGLVFAISPQLPQKMKLCLLQKCSKVAYKLIILLCYYESVTNSVFKVKAT